MHVKKRLAFLSTLLILSMILFHTAAFAGTDGDAQTFKNEKYYYKLGNFNADLKNYREAVKAYTQALHLKPDYAEAYVRLGIIYQQKGMYRDALELFLKAINIKPDYAEAHYYLGVSYERPSMYRNAIAAFKEAIKNKPGYAEAHYNLGVAYIVLNDIGSALAEYDILKHINAETAHKLFHQILK